MSLPARCQGHGRRRRARPGHGRVRVGMKIDAQHIDEPGLVVLDITAADE
ncbi:DUF6207 family protein [Streptomyces sp. NBC_01435]|nr:DUF6207 family protein [Streptomyces sp. NBC_01435]